MKRHVILLALMMVFLLGAIAQSRSRTLSPEPQQLLQLLGTVQAQQRGGGGRGSPTVTGGVTPSQVMTLEMREALTRAQWMQLQSPQRVRVGANVVAANLISQVEPVYPESARQAGIQGAVVLEAEIGRDGTVETLKVISGNPLLTQAALDAVKQWRYKPILLNGEPTFLVTTITVNFPFSAATRGAPSPSQGGPGQRRGQ